MQSNIQSNLASDGVARGADHSLCPDRGQRPGRSVHESVIGFLLALFLVILAPGARSAPTPTIRLHQPGAVPAYETVLGWLASHRGPGVHAVALDNFSFAHEEIITEVRWEGVYFDFGNPNNNPVPPNSREWRISVWSDQNGAPGRELFSETRSASEVTRTEFATVPFEILEDYGTFWIPAHRFSLVLNDRFTAAANTTYWLSVVNEASMNEPEFLQSVSFRKAPVPQMSWTTLFEPTDGLLWRNFRRGQDFTLPHDLVMTLLSVPGNDSDGDGMDDEWEAQHELDPSSDDSGADPDDDGSSNLREFERRTDPQNPDTDGDGLSDGVETATGIYLDETDTGTDPLQKDTDRDGLTDQQESETDPNRIDTDGDGYADDLELRNGFDPTDAADYPALIVLGTGNSALLGGDLTDPENDGAADAYTDYNAEFESSDLGGFGGGFQPFNVFDNHLGHSPDEWWTNLTTDPDSYYVWAQATFDAPIHLTHFTIASASTDPERDPHVWEIQGSNDGIHFETIFHRWNLDESVWTERSQVVRFNAGVHFETPRPYTTIRFACYGSGPGPGFEVKLGELEFFGTEDTLAISDFEAVGNDRVQIRWNSIPGRKYVIEKSPDLEEWTVISDVLAPEGYEASFTDDILTEPALRSAFYRVREAP